MFEIVLANFQIDDKFGRSHFFQKTVLLTTTNIEVVLGILFLIFSNVDILFIKQELT